jgi:hypothetical protein
VGGFFDKDMNIAEIMINIKNWKYIIPSRSVPSLRHRKIRSAKVRNRTINDALKMVGLLIKAPITAAEPRIMLATIVATPGSTFLTTPPHFVYLGY